MLTVGQEVQWKAAMDIKKLRNPYDYANPVQDSSIFAGRRTELIRISSTLEQMTSTEAVKYIAVHGKRAAGKTSLLNITETLARKLGHFVVHIDLIASDTTPVNFFTKLYEELIDTVDRTAILCAPDGRRITSRLIRRIINGTLPEDDFPLEFPESLQHAHSGGRLSEVALRTDLTYIAEHIQRPMLIVVDEAQTITADMNILSILRSLGAQLRGYAFILAGTTDFIGQINEVFAPLVRQFDMIKVERFIEEADVLDCMARPLASLGLDADRCVNNLRGTARNLMELTDGNPYEIQLYSHVMFSRWQHGDTPQMLLSPETLDSVRALMEAGRDVHERPIISAVRKMKDEELVAFNILCSSLGFATVDDTWFAHSLPGHPNFSREQFDRFRDRFLASEIIEMNGGVIRLPEDADLFDEVYIRLFTSTKIRQRHPQLLGHYQARHLLSRHLEYLLCEFIPEPVRILRTCCYAMHPRHLERGLSALDSLVEGEYGNFTVPFIHQAILKCGRPSALDLTAVECSFNGTTAVRWLYAADSEDYEISDSPAFIEARNRISELGGQLQADRTRLPLRPWEQVVDWLVSTVPAKTRSEMATDYIDTSFEAYAQGNVDQTIEYLTAAFRLEPLWSAANNLTYLSLSTNELVQAMEWANKALALTVNPKQRALTRYNAAMALLQSGDPRTAVEWLEEASSDLTPLPVPDYTCSYLLIPKFRDSSLILQEESEVELNGAIRNAVEVAEFAERYERLHDSGNGSTN
jgi:tetratricopeptide (TPR) repeat protein